MSKSIGLLRRLPAQKINVTAKTDTKNATVKTKARTVTAEPNTVTVKPRARTVTAKRRARHVTAEMATRIKTRRLVRKSTKIPATRLCPRSLVVETSRLLDPAEAYLSHPPGPTARTAPAQVPHRPVPRPESAQVAAAIPLTGRS